MLTSFGKFCRKLRIDRGELLLDMANKLGVSAAFLSSVENGKKKPPVAWEGILIKLYDMDEKMINELHDCFFEARNIDSIDITSYNKSEKEMMLAFARKINTFDESRLNKLRKMIND